MTIDLHRLIELGEGQELDFKFRVDDQRKIARTLVAFANTSGGKLLIGVKDNGKIAGVDPDEEFHMIQGAAELYCKPPIHFSSFIWKDDKHLILIVEVEKNLIRHKALNEEGEWSTFYRLGDNTVKGNKVLDKAWVLRNTNFVQPEHFSEEAIGLIRLLRTRGQMSFSAMNRVSELKPTQLINLLASLMTWGIIDAVVLDEGLVYLLIQVE